MGIKSFVLTVVLTLVSFSGFAKTEGLTVGLGNYELSSEVGFSSKSANLDDFSASYDYSISGIDIGYVHKFSPNFFAVLGYTTSLDSGDLDSKNVNSVSDQTFARVKLGIGYTDNDYAAYEIWVEGTNIQSDYTGFNSTAKFEDSYDDLSIYIVRTNRIDFDDVFIDFDFGGFIGWTEHEVGVLDMLNAPQKATFESTQIGLLFNAGIGYIITENFKLALNGQYRFSQEVDSDVSLTNGYAATLNKAEYDVYSYSLNATYSF